MKKKVLLIIIWLLLSLLQGCLKSSDDKDHDGLPDEIEEKGWTVKVVYPFNNTPVEYHVKSDPNKKDTDGDWLSDYEEVKIFSSNPTDWRDDIDGDNYFWEGDYEEILFYMEKGIDNETIKQYIQNSDVDADGVPDGKDMDPLRDIKIEVIIHSILVLSNKDDDDDLLETNVNISVGEEWAEDEFPIIVKENHSLNFSCILDVNDTGMPGNSTFPLMIIVRDMDEKMDEFKPLDKDGFPSFDFIRVFEGNVYVYAVDFNISRDLGKYHMRGVDGEIWFEIRDASIAKS